MGLSRAIKLLNTALYHIVHWHSHVFKQTERQLDLFNGIYYCWGNHAVEMSFTVMGFNRVHTMEWWWEILTGETSNDEHTKAAVNNDNMYSSRAVKGLSHPMRQVATCCTCNSQHLESNNTAARLGRLIQVNSLGHPSVDRLWYRADSMSVALQLQLSSQVI